jgi:hypothetical protein
MALGRVLDASVDTGNDAVRAVVISHRLWRRMLAADPDAIGRRIRVNDMDLEVVGVLREGFRTWLPPSSRVTEETDVWFPRPPEVGWTNRTAGVVARLSPGVSLDGARSEFASLARRLNTDNAGVYADAAGALEFEVDPLRRVVAFLRVLRETTGLTPRLPGNDS